METNEFARNNHRSVVGRGFFEPGAMPIEDVPIEAVAYLIRQSLRYAPAMEAMVKRGDVSRISTGILDESSQALAGVPKPLLQQAIWNWLEAVEVLRHLWIYGMEGPEGLRNEIADAVVTAVVLAIEAGIEDLEAAVWDKVRHDEQRGIRHNGDPVAVCMEISRRLPR